MSHKIEQILTSEGVEIIHPRSVVRIPENCRKAAIDLFRFLPELSDPRWSLAYMWASARQLGVKGIHEESSQLAIYLSHTPGYRTGYSSFQSEENFRLISRATINLSSIQYVRHRFSQCSPPDRFQFALTNKITRGTNRDGTTGCPEALYQIQLRISRYLGRVSFNIHQESSVKVVSISNIQGVPDAQVDYARYEDHFGENPFVELAKFVKSMFPSMSVRGIKNPKINPGFYNTVLKNAGITRMDYISR